MDWNGTAFKYCTDEIQNKLIAYAVLDDAKAALKRGNVLRAWDVVKLGLTKSKLKKRLQQYKDGERHLWEVYEPFNEGVLKGIPVDFLKAIINKYARYERNEVDDRVMRPMQTVHRDGKGTGILSVSFDYSIRKILEESGYADVIDDIVANTLETDGNNVVGLTLDIYGKKPEVMRREFFENRGLREDDTLYLGDSEDDEPIAEMIDRGSFIVPFFALDEFKQMMASKHKAFVPKSEEDLLKYLQSK